MLEATLQEPGLETRLPLWLGLSLSLPASVCHHPAGGYLLFLVSGQSAFCFPPLTCRVETTLAGSGLLMLDLEDQDVPLGVVVLGKL